MENPIIQNSVQSDIPNPPPKQFPFLPVLLSLLSLLLLLSSSYLAYQNIQLTKQIANVQITPFPTAEPSPTIRINQHAFTSKELGISFQYPSDWTLRQSPLAIINAAQDRIITVGVISQNTLNVLGITYCGAHPEDTKECEKLIVDNQTIAIEWMGTSFNATAANSKGKLTVTMMSLPENNVNPPKLTEEDKTFFRTFLSTFKFTDQASSTRCTPLPSCAHNQDPNGAVCKIGEKPPSGGSWCPRYTCPPNGWADCEPPLKQACSEEAMVWYKANCPDFQGGAL